MLFFVTGASGSGKSACLPGLRQTLPDIDWHDFDELGVPASCSLEWRQHTTEDWLTEAISNEHRQLDTGVAGGAILGEVLACPSAPQVKSIHVALLDCHDWTRIDRLRERGAHATQDMLNWAAWQRMHAIDPQWRPDVIRNGCDPSMKWERWAEWLRGDPRWRVEVIDTTVLSIGKVVDRLAEWVTATSSKTNKYDSRPET